MSAFKDAREEASGWEWNATEHDKDIWNAALDAAINVAREIDNATTDFISGETIAAAIEWLKEE